MRTSTLKIGQYFIHASFDTAIERIKWEHDNRKFYARFGIRCRVMPERRKDVSRVSAK